MRFEVFMVNLSRIWAQRSWEIFTPNRMRSMVHVALIHHYLPLFHSFSQQTVTLDYYQFSTWVMGSVAGWFNPGNTCSSCDKAGEKVDNPKLNAHDPNIISWLVLTVLRNLLPKISWIIIWTAHFFISPRSPWFSAVLYTLREVLCIWLHITTFPTSDTLWLWTTWYVPQRSWTSVYSVKLVWGHVGKGSNRL